MTTQFEIPGLELLAPLGAGVQGSVFLARRGDEQYAVKLYRELGGARGASSVRHFRREAAALARVRHVTIPQILEIGSTDRGPYIVMELARGEPLSSMLRKGPVDPGLVVDLARWLAVGLEAVHRSGLVHRDIKPDNVVIEIEPLSVRLVDFGFAAALEPRLLGTERAGTRAYMAPEQASGDGRVDARADLYSLGCVLFECLTGERYAVGRTLAAVPATLEPMLRRLLAADPDERLGSAAELVDVLGTLRLGSPAPALAQRHPASALVGREFELERVLAAWADARMGRGCAVRVLGSAGSGKTRLCAAVMEELGRDGASVFAATCELGEAVPFSVMRQLLKARLDIARALSGAKRAEAFARIRAVAGDLAPILGLMVPGYEKLLPDLGRPPRSDDAEHVMAESLAELCARLFRDRAPALVVVDDVQWIDSGSRRVLAKLADRVSRDACLLVLSARNDGAKELEPILRAFVDDSLDVSLGALSNEDLAPLVSTQLGGSAVEPEVLEAIRGLWDGSPMGAMELVCAMLESGVLVPHWGRWKLDPQALARMHLPRTCSELIAQRIDELDASVREILSAAAVLGTEFDDRMLARTCGVPEHEIQGVLAEARDARLASLGQRGAHRLVHGAVRDALLGRLSPERLRAVHQSVAEAMSGSDEPEQDGARTPSEVVFAMMANELDEPGSDDPERVARWFAAAAHFARGEPWKAPELGLRSTLRAGRLAFRSFDSARALQYFAAAEAAAAVLGRELGPDSHYLIAEAHLRVGALERSLERFQLVLAASSDPLLLAFTHCRMAWVHMQLDEDAAWRSLDQGFLALSVRPPVDELAAVSSEISRWIVSRTRTPRLVTDATQRRRLEILSALYYQTCRLAVQSTRNVRLVQAVMGGLSAAERLGPCEALAKSYFFYGFLLYNLGFRRAGRRYCTAAETIATDTRDPVAYSHALQVLHAITAWAGDMHAAIRYATICLREYGHWRELTEYCLVAHGVEQILSLQGRASEAYEWLKQAVLKVEQHEGARMPLDFLEFSVQAALVSLGREREVSAALARMRRAGIESPRKAVFVGGAQASRVRQFTEPMQLGEEFERFVAEVRAQNHDPRRVHLAMTEYYVHVAHARLHQCLRASPAARGERLHAFAGSLSDLRKAARVPLLRAHLLALQAQLDWMQSKWDAATRSFSKAERLGLEENAPWVLYTVHRGRAHMLLAQGKPDIARDQAALAEALAARHGAVHRVRFVREEFGKGIVARADQTVTSSLSLLIGAASSSERGSSHSGSRPRGYLKALQRITRASRGELDPALQSRVVLDELLNAMRAQLGMLLVMREDSPERVETLDQLSVAAVRGDDAGRGGSSLQRVLVDRALQTASPAMSGERKPCIAVPLLVRETPVGAVYLERAPGAQAFTDADAEMLNALAAQVPGALELARMLYERERAAETARITDKMGALARFARGVSHDISNLFQQVLVTTEWLSDQDAGAELGEQLGGIRESIRRAARLTERLNAFARGGTPSPPQALDLEGEIEAMRPVLGSVLGADVELEIVIAAGLWHVRIDSAELDQMLLNLASNAREAMSAGGRFSLELRNVLLDETFMSLAPWVTNRECVEILVRDSGSGMDADTYSHIFEPYFTTKESGRGLGLATVYGVVRQNGGHIEVESELGTGTTFRIRLPRYLGVAAEKARRPEGAAVASGTFVRTVPGNAGQPRRRVLVVDDEPDVNAALCRMLEHKGYDSLPALSGAEALELYRTHATEIDAVVTDLVMPGMNGIELCREIVKLRPVPTIVVSGASDDVIVAHGLAGASNFLHKPVFPNDLDAKLRALLGSPSHSRAISGRSSS